MSIHPDVPRVNRSNFDALHAGADFHAGGLGGEAERFDHLLLAFGRGSVVGAHGGDEKRFGPVPAKPISSRFGDGQQVRDPSTPCRNGHLRLGRFFAHLIQRLVDKLGNVSRGDGDELLIHPINDHPETLECFFVETSV